MKIAAAQKEKEIAAATGRRRQEDRLSKLSDATLGRILSFLPSKEAARAALLSSRWRDAFAGVDAVSLEEPESTIPEDEEHDGYDSDYYTGRGHRTPLNPNPKPSFTTVVTSALLARHRVPAAPAPPLRGLRVVCDSYRPEDAPTVDHCMLYALNQAELAPAGLELDLRLGRKHLCNVSNQGEANRGRWMTASDDDSDMEPYDHYTPRYSVPRRLFSCAALRSLSIGPCWLSPPAAVSLPSLEVLLLARVSDHERRIQRLVDGCPRLADLTLEACGTVTTLSLLGNRRLRRLALRCCHYLAKVSVAADSKLHSLEYRGDVPDVSLLDLHDVARSSITSCKIDICGEEVSSARELTMLGEFLQLLPSIRHLHLQSARLGFGIQLDAPATLPMFTSLLQLELTGHLLHGDGTAAVSRILRHAPTLAVLSLFFDTGPSDDELHARESWEECTEGEVFDAHQLRYNEHEVLPAMPAASIPCLMKHVREINLVNYHGGSAQRMLACFLLCNAAVLDRLYCGFAPWPLWIQTKLRDEIQGRATTSLENCNFD